MELHFAYDLRADSLMTLRSSLDDDNNKILDKLIEEHFDEEDWPMNTLSDLANLLWWFQETLHPEWMHVSYYEECSDQAVCLSYTVPDEILEAVKSSLDSPQEDLPTFINSKNPIKKIISDWRLKNG